jgi:hypothetical protein
MLRCKRRDEAVRKEGVTTGARSRGKHINDIPRVEAGEVYNVPFPEIVSHLAFLLDA